jgi:hypothetical protein
MFRPRPAYFKVWPCPGNLAASLASCRQSGSNPGNISKDPGCRGGQTVRNARPTLLQFAEPDVAVADWVVVVLQSWGSAHLRRDRLLAPQLARLPRPHRGPRAFHPHQILAPLPRLAPASQINFSGLPLNITAGLRVSQDLRTAWRKSGRIATWICSANAGALHE